MADNLSISTAGGTITLGTDEISSVHYQRNKLIFGVDGANDGDVAQALPLPVSSALRTDVIQNVGSQLTPKFAYVTNLSASGNLVAAVASKKIRVLSFHAEEKDQTGDVILTVQDASGGSTLFLATGFDLKDKTLPFSPVGWFETTAGNALYGTVAGTSPDLNIVVVYVEV